MVAVPLEVSGLVKRYGAFTAVDHLSFQVHAGEIVGLLGPNGAGKTTTIRMVMDIFRPDEGTIRVLGRPPAEVRAQVGYLPEERGLYPDLGVADVLVYLAQLKGTARAEAKRRADAWLARMGLSEWAERKVRDLSRGMQQKVQFAASLIHDPEVVILDEPFQGLDPVNVDLLKTMIRELAASGKAVVLSAHEMSLVEALCDRIVLVNRGRTVLAGRLDEIKRRYARNVVRVRTPAELRVVPGVSHISRRDGTYLLTLQGASPQDVLRALVEGDILVERFEVASAPLDEIFVAAVKEEGSDG